MKNHRANRPANPASRHKRNTLQQRLLYTILPVILLPILLAGGFSYLTTSQKERDKALDRLQENSELMRQGTDVFLNNRLNYSQVLVESPDVFTLFEQAAAKVKNENLTAMKEADLNAKFQANNLLLPSNNVNQYLIRVARQRALDQIFFTDANGFNLASSLRTNDFVQAGKNWWQKAKAQQIWVDSPEFDESVNSNVIGISKSLYHPNTNNFIGVVKVKIKEEIFNRELANFVKRQFRNSELSQLVNTSTSNAISSFNDRGEVASRDIEGGEAIAKFAQAMIQIKQRGDLSNPTALEQELRKANLVSAVTKFEVTETENQARILSVTVQQGDRYYHLQDVPNTNWVAIASATESEINSAGQQLLLAFLGISGLLAIAVTIGVSILAKQIAQPLQGMATDALKVKEGDFSIRTKAEGTDETETLATSFNSLLDTVETLLAEQKNAAVTQQQQREELEQDVLRLMEDVSGAAEGDLTVRAQISPGEIGIIADLFNSIIENLRDTAFQVKSSSGQVSMSLDANAQSIRQLATQAITEADSLRQTMLSVETMSESIREVATNADSASQLTTETYTTVQDGSQYMEQSVQSILGLRATVSETAKKIKRLGESAQKISQTVSLIDEIALKTNLLAVNASVEAARAGELGQGFTAVAEQVGALAEQSTSATREIAQIVAAIQAETQEVVAAIETGTAQVVDSTKLISATKQRLVQVLEKSAQVNELMQSISTATTAQRQTSAQVTEQVKAATLGSEQRSKASEAMAMAIADTANIARSLQESVARFQLAKVSPEERLASSDDAIAPNVIEQPSDASSDDALEIAHLESIEVCS